MAEGSELLTSSNSKLKYLRKLVGQRKTRSAERVFVVEGPVLVREALDSALSVQSVYVDGRSVDDLSSGFLPEFESITRRAINDDAVIHHCRVDALSSAMSTVTPQPIAAIVSQPERSFDDFASDDEMQRPVLVVVDLRDPGNAGTLARSAEASGCAGMVFAGTSVDVWSPKVVRSSGGALLRMPIVVEPDTTQAIEQLQGQNRPVVATVIGPEVSSHDQVDLTSAAIVLGNEAHGLDDTTVALSDQPVTIGLDGPTESLNVAMAGTVLCFESLRQRRLKVASSGGT